MNKGQIASLRAALGSTAVSVDTIIKMVINSKNPEHALEAVMGVYEAPVIIQESPKGTLVEYNPWEEYHRRVTYQPSVETRYTNDEGIKEVARGQSPYTHKKAQSEQHPHAYTYTPSVTTTSLEDWNKG